MKLSLDRFILLVQGMPPYIGKKNVFYEDPVFKARMTEKPAFSNREEAVQKAKSTIAKLQKGPHWFDLAAEKKKADQADEEPETRDAEFSEDQAAAFMEAFQEEFAGDAAAPPAAAAAAEDAFTFSIDNFIKPE
jgi:hypothetical protein